MVDQTLRSFEICILHYGAKKLFSAINLWLLVDTKWTNNIYYRNNVIFWNNG